MEGIEHEHRRPARNEAPQSPKRATLPDEAELLARLKRTLENQEFERQLYPYFLELADSTVSARVVSSVVVAAIFSYTNGLQSHHAELLCRIAPYLAEAMVDDRDVARDVVHITAEMLRRPA